MRRASSRRVSAICFPAPLKDRATRPPAGHSAGAIRQLPGRAERPLIFSLMQSSGTAPNPTATPSTSRATRCRHAVAHRTDAGLLRRPPGRERRRRGRGADDRRLASTSRPSTPAAIGTRTESSACSPSSALPVRRLGPGLLGRRACRPAGHPNGGTATPPNADIPPRPTPAASGPARLRLRPAQLPAQRRQGAGAEVRFPPGAPGISRAAVDNYCTTANNPDPVVTFCAADPEHRHRDPLLLARLARAVAATSRTPPERRVKPVATCLGGRSWLRADGEAGFSSRAYAQPDRVVQWTGGRSFATRRSESRRR